MAKKLYQADRDFNHFRKDEIVELDEDNPYVRTGYLVEWEPQEPTGPEQPPALASTTTEDVETDGDGEGEGGAGRPARTRGRK